jgi:hypothetical protein
VPYEEPSGPSDVRKYWLSHDKGESLPRERYIARSISRGYNIKMATNLKQLDLTPEQVQRLEELAERTGSSYSELLDEWLATARPIQPAQAKVANAVEKSLHDVLAERGMLGCFDGPTDLSTNPKHMAGFGRNGSGSNSH